VTTDEARDIMLGLIQEVATAQEVPLTFTDVPAKVPSANTVWGRVVLRHGTGGQGSLTGGLGVTLYDAGGVLWLQLFAPIGDGSTAGYQKSQYFLNALRTYRGSVWFRNMRVMERGKEGAFERIDVISDFEYTDSQ
jgi:hypothetical protein